MSLISHSVSAMSEPASSSVDSITDVEPLESWTNSRSPSASAVMRLATGCNYHRWRAQKPDHPTERDIRTIPRLILQARPDLPEGEQCSFGDVVIHAHAVFVRVAHVRRQVEPIREPGQRR